MRCVVFALTALCLCVAAEATPRACISAEQAAAKLDKDVCLAAHVYEVVEVSDGTRFLDICAPATPDSLCRFTVVSHKEDRADVGELGGYRNSDVRIRGVVASMHGRSGILLSHARQFAGGPPKFRPNPRLLHGFSGDQGRPPISDPNLRSQGGRRAFMNSRERVQMPLK